MNFSFQLILLTLSSYLISLVLTPLTIRLFYKRGWVEDPRQKQQKTGNATALYPVPRGGGIPLFLGFALPVLFFTSLTPRVIALLVSGLITVIVGVVDDLQDISPRLRLFTNALAAIILISSGIGIAYISNPFLSGTTLDLSHFKLVFDLFSKTHQLWYVSAGIAFFWIIWCMNIVGWSSGVEGQLPGFTAISAVFIAILSLRFAPDHSELQVVLLAFALSGSFLGFLPFNFFPQKIMPGYSGKSFAGLMLGVLAIYSGAKVATLIFLLFIPMLDALYAIFRRLKKGQPIYLGDGQHFHHLLLQAGFSRKQIALFYWLITLLLGLVSLSLNSTQKLYVFVGLTLLFIGSIFILSQYISRKPSQTAN